MTTAMKLREAGIREGKIDDAKKMKNEGLDINLIQKIILWGVLCYFI